MNKYLGIEIGGTKQQIGIGTEKGEILYSESVKLQYREGAADILEWIQDRTWKLLENYPDICRIGVGFGGPLESVTGRILCSLQVPGWKDFRLKNWFEEKFHMDTCVVNDTVAGGLAELKCGAGAGSDHLFYTNIGTGIGGGLFIHGKYYDGVGFGASYLGNSLIPDWTVSESGKAIRLELICSGRSIEERLNRPGYLPEHTFLGDRWKEMGRVSCADLGDGVRAGDQFCMEELDRTAESFSIGLANVLALAAPNCIVVGGGVAKMGDILFERLKKFTDRYAFVANQGQYEIRPSKLMDQAVLVGAVLAAAGELNV